MSCHVEIIEFLKDNYVVYYDIDDGTIYNVRGHILYTVIIMQGMINVDNFNIEVESEEIEDK